MPVVDERVVDDIVVVDIVVDVSVSVVAETVVDDIEVDVSVSVVDEAVVDDIVVDVSVSVVDEAVAFWRRRRKSNNTASRVGWLRKQTFITRACVRVRARGDTMKEEGLFQQRLQAAVPCKTNNRYSSGALLRNPTSSDAYY